MKRRTRNNQFFTLIELVVVILIVGTLMAIVLPNIASFKKEASTTAMTADGRNIQTAVDRYHLEHNGNYPTEDEPTVGKPKRLDLNLLHPDTIRNLPKYDNMYYWIDYQGQVWYSTTDNPIDFQKGDTSLTWTPKEDVQSYTIYEVINETTRTQVKMLETLPKGSGSYTPNGYSKSKTYLISVEDAYGFHAAPVGELYAGSEPFQEDNPPTETIPPEPTPDTPPPTWIAAGEQKVVSTSGSQQLGPQITPDGKFVIWADERNGMFDIYKKNLETNEEFNLSNAPSHEYPAQITPDGKLVVWMDYRNGNWDIYGKSLITNQEFVVTNAAGEQEYPQITPDGKFVVWHDNRNNINERYAIYGKNLVTNQEFLIASEEYSDQMYPQITDDGRFVVWQDNRYGHNDIYGKNLITNQEFIISNAVEDQFYPQITPDGKLVVWQDRRSGEFDIYGKNLVTNQEFVISNATGSQEHPQITPDGKLVVWADRRNGSQDIYGKNLVTNQEFVISVAIGYQVHPQITDDGRFITYSSTEYDEYPNTEYGETAEGHDLSIFGMYTTVVKEISALTQ